MKLQKLLSYERQAINEYNMINDGDRIAVGLSGGKDSLTLLYSFARLHEFLPEKFELCAIMVDIGIPNFETELIEEFCKDLGVKLYIVKTQIYQIVFDYRKEKNPCSLCATLRKGALYDKMHELGFNKIAYAHHKDDFIETFFMSMFYEGRLNTFAPLFKLEDSDITIIRPLIFVSEGEIKCFTEKMKLPVVSSKCQADGNTKREYTKQLIKQISIENPNVKNKMFSAIKNGGVFDSEYK